VNLPESSDSYKLRLSSYKEGKLKSVCEEGQKASIEHFGPHSAQAHLFQIYQLIEEHVRNKLPDQLDISEKQVLLEKIFALQTPIFASLLKPHVTAKMDDQTADVASGIILRMNVAVNQLTLGKLDVRRPKTFLSPMASANLNLSFVASKKDRQPNDYMV